MRDRRVKVGLSLHERDETRHFDEWRRSGSPIAVVHVSAASVHEKSHAVADRRVPWHSPEAAPAHRSSRADIRPPRALS